MDVRLDEISSSMYLIIIPNIYSCTSYRGSMDHG
jgi:hypothetical protein